MVIKVKTVYVTEDGKEHSSEEMARHWELYQHLVMEMKSSVLHSLGTDYETTPADFINWLDDNRNSVIAYLNATEAMKKASLT